MIRSAIVAWALLLTAASGASAQSAASGDSAGANSSSGLKPATTTFLGDTGLWFVPTAEVLASGKWSVSGYRRGTNYVQGFSNVGDFAGTVAYGFGRAEVFSSFNFITRIDRDLRPLFISDPIVGGIIDRYPGMRTTWSGNNVGDLSVGAKVALLPRTDLHPLDLAVRGIVKMPTGDEESGASTGKTDFLADFIASKELKEVVELSGYVGYEWRGEPDDYDLPGGAFRWGVGGGFPSRTPLRGTLELNGVAVSGDTATITGPALIGVDGSVAPLASTVHNITRATAGLTWQNASGFFIGGGLSWNVPRRNRDLYGTDADNFGDFVDWQVRIGFHPGARPAPAPPVAPPAPPAAEAPAPAPAPAPPAPAAPAQETAPRAAEAPVRSYTFEDVHFDFDRYSLRQEATRSLDDVVNAMRQDTNLRLEIEGHTCNIGTAEYNLALGDRRANAVRTYLVSRGVAADRLRTISYGEERPKHDNAREETRRLNRRAALVVNLR